MLYADQLRVLGFLSAGITKLNNVLVASNDRLCSFGGFQSKTACLLAWLLSPRCWVFQLAPVLSLLKLEGILLIFGFCIGYTEIQTINGPVNITSNGGLVADETCTLTAFNNIQTIVGAINLQNNSISSVTGMT